MKPVTFWYKQHVNNDKSIEYFYNHCSDGHATEDEPRAISKWQEDKWKNQIWKKKHGNAYDNLPLVITKEEADDT